MALNKANEAISQRTTTGQSTTITVSDSYRHSFYIKHVNGTGSITTGAIVKVQVRPSSSSTWYDLLSITFGLTASATETRAVPLPDDAAETRLDYTVPSGSSGHTLDGEVGQITAY